MADCTPSAVFPLACKTPRDQRRARADARLWLKFVVAWMLKASSPQHCWAGLVDVDIVWKFSDSPMGLLFVAEALLRQSKYRFAVALDFGSFFLCAVVPALLV